MTTFKLDNNTTIHNLIATRYDIYIDGGRYVKIDSAFKIRILNKTTKEPVSIYEYGLKLRDFNGVRYFYCDIPHTDQYEISFKYFEGIVVKKSMLRMLRQFQSNIDLEKIRIRIERK